MPELNFDLAISLSGQQYTFQAQLDMPRMQGVIGHSGCGKTTLLRILAGLEQRAKGQVSFAGEQWQHSDNDHFIASHERPTVMVFQDVRLLGHLNVQDNILFGAKSAGLRANYWQQLVDVLKLKELLKRHPSHLSGGEKQRVGLARALLADAKLWLFDEPLSAVDSQHKSDILRFLTTHLAQRGAHGVYVTHQHYELNLLDAPALNIDKNTERMHSAQVVAMRGL